MIEVRYIDEETWMPMVICDQCNCPIDLQRKDVGTIPGGIAVWPADTTCPTGSLTDPRVGQRPALHLHKGRCEMKATRKMRGDYRWEEIDLHFFQVIYNLGLRSAVQFAELRQRAKLSADLKL